MAATKKDLVATALTAASVLVVWANVAEWGLPLTTNAHIAGVVALAFGIAACAVGAADSELAEPTSDRYQRAMTTLGGASGVAVLIAILTGWQPALIAFALFNTALWALATTRHVRASSPVPA